MRRYMARNGVRHSGEDGAVAVEFALILPLLVLILVGVFEFGVAWSKVQVFEGAAREGARCAAVQAAELNAGLPVCNVETRVRDAAGSYESSLPATFSIGVCSATSIGDEVTVSWEQPLKLSIPFWGDVSFSRHIAGTFRCE